MSEGERARPNSLYVPTLVIQAPAQLLALVPVASGGVDEASGGADEASGGDLKSNLALARVTQSFLKRESLPMRKRGASKRGWFSLRSSSCCDLHVIQRLLHSYHHITPHSCQHHTQHLTPATTTHNTPLLPTPHTTPHSCHHHTQHLTPATTTHNTPLLPTPHTTPHSCHHHTQHTTHTV